MAEELKRANEVEVEVVKGGLLELSVAVDGEKLIETNRLWYPLPSTLVRKTRELLDRGSHPISRERLGDHNSLLK